MRKTGWPERTQMFFCREVLFPQQRTFLLYRQRTVGMGKNGAVDPGRPTASHGKYLQVDGVITICNINMFIACRKGFLSERRD